MTFRSEAYVEYLDKEMTIVGVLTVFCVSALAGILHAVLSAKKGETIAVDLWYLSRPYLLIASGLLLAAALLFYRQRSLLAWFYGQICLSEVTNGSNGAVDEWLKDADSWETWIDYRLAFAALVLSFYLYSCAILSTSSSFVPKHPLIVILVPAIVVTMYAGLMTMVMIKHKFSDEPWREFFRDLRYGKSR